MRSFLSILVVTLFLPVNNVFIKEHSIRFKVLLSNFLLVLGLVLVSSCDDYMVFDEYKSISSNGWSKDEPKVFNISLQDTITKNNVFIIVRNSIDYEYSNLYLFTKVEFPDGRVLIDTLEYEMTNTEGRWLGDGLSDIKTNLLYFKKDVIFYEKGNYHLTITHGMRDDDLKGIRDIGFRIEKNY